MKRAKSSRSSLAVLTCLVVASGLVSVAKGALAADPQQFLPPELPWKGESESLVVKGDDPWITPAETTGLTDSPNYDETVNYLRRVTASSPLFRLVEFGRSAQGRAMYVVVGSRDGAFTAAAVGTSGKPVLLVQSGIHSGEIDGKDAGLMLIRDIAFRGKESLLERVQLLFVPIFNVDGHERGSRWNRANQRGPVHQGWRSTAQGLNLNRDYMKADTPEMKAMLTLIRDWEPSLYLDLHVSDDSDYEYDITFGFNGEPGVFAWSPGIGDWLSRVFRPEVNEALSKSGHLPGPLVFPLDARDPTKGHRAGTSMPRFSGGYGDLRHLPTVLVENHALKPYRQRVLGTYVLVETALRVLAENGAELKRVTVEDAARRPARLPFNWGNFDGPLTNRPFRGVDFERYPSAVSGGVEIRWLGRPRAYAGLPVQLDRPALELTRPHAYWVPVTASAVIDRLALHGIRMERITESREMTVQMYRLVDAGSISGGAQPFYEGRTPMRTHVRVENRTESFPVGSVRVPTDQPLGDLAMALLEPESRDSLFAWGFFAELLQESEYIEGYVAEPMARWMLENDPGLREAFEAKLAADSAFASSAEARLRWFYERSPFFDQRHLLYPVGREVE